MKLADLLNNLFAASGLDQTNEHVKNLILATASIDLPNEINTKINENFLTRDAAKADTGIKDFFRHSLFGGIDQTVKETLMNELGITEDQYKEIYVEKKSGQTVKNALLKVAELTKAAAKANPGEDKNALVKELNEAKQALATLSNDSKISLSKKDEEFAEMLSDILVENHLAGVNYASPISKEANTITAKTLTSQELKEKGYKLITENKRLRLVKTDGTDVFENNKKVEAQDFLDSVIAKNKLAAVNDPAPAQPKQPIVIPGQQGPSQVASATSENLRLFREATAPKN